MLEVLQFVLSGFWVFLGVLMLIEAVGRAVALVAVATIGALRIQRLRLRGGGV